jgi:hypothetical protein
MEISRRVLSSNEFTYSNIILSLSLFSLKCIFCYIIYSYATQFLLELISKISFHRRENYNYMTKIFKNAFFFLICGLYSLLIIYLFHIANFFEIRSANFNYWNNLFISDSNVRDIGSFDLFYCNNKNESSSISFLCFWKYFDFCKFECYLMKAIIFIQVIKGYYKFKNKNEVSFTNISYVIDVIFILFYVALLISYTILYFRIHIEYSNRSYGAYTNPSKTKDHPIHEKVQPPTYVKKSSSHESIFDIIFEVLDILTDILG